MDGSMDGWMMDRCWVDGVWMMDGVEEPTREERKELGAENSFLSFQQFSVFVFEFHSFNKFSCVSL